MKRGRKIALLIMINGLFLLFVLARRQNGFEGNDDELMNLIAAGGFGSSNAHLIYMSAIAEGFISLLYRLPFFLNYYLMFLLAVSFLSISIITSVCFAKYPLRIGVLCTLGLNLLFLFDFEVSLQYTKSAALLASAGVILMHLGSRSGSVRRSLFGLLFLIAALSIRLESALFTLPFFLWWMKESIGFELFHPETWKHSLQMARTTRRLWAVAVSAAAALFSILVGRLPYLTRAWREYEIYNKARTALLDYGMADYETHADEYVSIGVSYTEYELLSKWVYADPEVFSAEKLQRINGIEKNRMSVQSLLEALRHLILALLHGSYAAGVILLGVVLFRHGRKDRQSLVWTSFLLILMEYLFLGVLGRINVRVELGIWIAPLLVFLYECRGSKVSLSVREGWIIGILSAAIVCRSGIAAFLQMQENQAEKTRMERFAEAVRNRNEDLYLLDEMTIYGEGMIFGSPYALTAGISGRFCNICPLGGWEYPAPFLMDNLSVYGVNNPLKDLLYQERVHLACSGREGIQDTILTCLQENYDPGAYMEQTDEIEGIPIYDFHVGS